MSTYKLYYFNNRDRGEICRLIFAAAGQKYEDIRYEDDEWLLHKAEMPLGEMPVLEFNAGRNYFEQAKVDAVVDTIEDLITKLIPVFDEQDDDKREELKFDNHLPWADLYFYNFLETILGINENCLDNYPSLKQNREEVEKQPKIAEYLKNRPKT
ncbi:unnamed protein product [Rotaria sordida]|nr:unnamed protein product [Rotaria sordida]CAF1558582.1 unnamed protein product [Rotaria sordida]